MKRSASLFLIFVLVMFIGSCSNNDVKNTVQGNLKTYYEMADGTWRCDDISYKDRLELTGRLNNAACDTVYVYLSNVDISFEQAWKASGLSSDMKDYFSADEAMLVEIRTE